jgi:hypothetical protein
MKKFIVLWIIISGLLSPLILCQPNKTYIHLLDAQQNPTYVYHLDLGTGGSPLDLTWLSLSKMIHLEDAHLRMFSIINVPDELRNLTRLKKLSLEFLRAQTVLPTPICFLSNLEVFIVQRGSFSELPNEFGQLKHLKELSIPQGKLAHLPDSFGDLSSLESADLNNNLISQLPSSIGHLSNLKCLNVRKNQLTSLTTSIGELKDLEQLDLGGNRISELPDEFGRLTNLRILNLNDEQVSKLPYSFYRLCKLEKLDLSANDLNEILPDIKYLNNLTYLNLSFNCLRSLPSEIAQLTQLKHLDIYGNSMDSSEIEKIRKLLPKCIVHGKCQNSYSNITWPQSWKQFKNDSLGVSFYYPDNYVIDALSYDTTIENVDYDLVFSMSVRDTGMVQEYFVESSASLTIKIGQMDFYDIANGEGFENVDASVEDTINANYDSKEDDNHESEGWSILGRQGMKEDASLISFGSIKGMEGENCTGTFGKNAAGEGSGYLGLREFTAGFAFCKGKYESISISFFSDMSGQESVFHQMISSLNIDQE